MGSGRSLRPRPGDRRCDRRIFDCDQKDKVADLEAELSDSQASLSESKDAQAAAEDRADAITDKKNQIIGQARGKAADLVSSAKDELAGYQDKLDQTKQDLTSTEGKLTSVQASLDQAQETKAKSSFGNGTWQSGVDYIPGTYSAPGGGGCYWEKLNGPSGGGLNNIIDNGGFDRNQIVSVDSPYFHTSGCGTWTLQGG